MSAKETRQVIEPLPRFSQALLETDSSSNSLRAYIYGLGLSSTINQDGQLYSYYFDGLGSVVALSDDNGVLLNRYGYQPYGELFKGSSSVLTNRFQFAGWFGVAQDNELIDMRIRFYDPEVGRFTVREPLALLAMQNPYWYALDNPVNWTDPDGRFPWLLAIIAVTGFLAPKAWKIAQIGPRVSTELLQVANDLLNGKTRDADGDINRILRKGGADAATNISVGRNPLPGLIMKRAADRTFCPIDSH